jgi:serine/threonine protein phosphatase PrpC
MVCDGHGSHGHQASQIVSKSVINSLSADKNMQDMLSDPDLTTGGVVQALVKACEDSQEKLKNTIGDEALYSGTTFICSVIHSNNVWTGCVGDSRAVIGAMKGNKVLSLDLSKDQNCADPKEKARIIAAGGKVRRFGDFYRVVAPDEGTVLAPTRSIGDCEFDIVGVIPRPEVTHYKLTGMEHVLIVASDGLWEFVSSAQAVQIAMGSEDATSACNKLVELSKRLWAQDGNGKYCDDITIIVAFLPLIPGQLGENATALRFCPKTVDGANGSDVELQIENETEHPEADPEQKRANRRRSMSNMENDGNTIGKDRSTVDDVSSRNTDSIDGLNPNAHERVPGRSWAPEWDRKMWPGGR